MVPVAACVFQAVFPAADVLRDAGRLASPPVLYTLALLIFFLGARTRFLRRPATGVVGALLVAAFLVLAAGDATFLRRLLDPRHLPAAAWALLTLSVLWLALHRARREPPPRGAWNGPSGAEWKAAFAASLLWIALALFLGAPLGPPADAAPRAPAGSLEATAPGTAGVDFPVPAKRPWFARGLQEAGFYFDPWVTNLLLPLILLSTLLALPYLDPEPDETPDGLQSAAAAPSSRERRLSIFLAATLLLVLLPILVATFLRGPYWNAYSPFEVWIAGPRPVPPVPLSERFWCDALGRNATPGLWPVREAPTLVLLVLYFVLLPRQLARWKATRGIFGRYRKSAGPWRYRIALTLALLLATVPLKMYSRWLLDVGYWLYLPELSFHF